MVHCRRALEWSLSAPEPPTQSFVDHLLDAVVAQLATRSRGEIRARSRRVAASRLGKSVE
jgi:hypothetical protein